MDVSKIIVSNPGGAQGPGGHLFELHKRQYFHLHITMPMQIQT
jgi:hypothetical protein